MSALENEEWTLTVGPVHPGWFIVPTDMGAQERTTWMAETFGSIRASWGDAWEDEHEKQVLRLLEEGLRVRAESPSTMIFQVWPILGPLALSCHVNVLSSDGLPDWSDLGAVVHSAEAPGIGPGLQCSVRRTLHEGDERIDLMSVHFIFDDGTTTLMLSLDETIAVALARALPGLTGVLESVRMERSDGTTFISIPPDGILEDAPWQLEDAE